MATHAAPSNPVTQAATAAITWLLSALWVSALPILAAVDSVLLAVLLEQHRQPTLAVVVVLGGILLDGVVTACVACEKAWT